MVVHKELKEQGKTAQQPEDEKTAVKATRTDREEFLDATERGLADLGQSDTEVAEKEADKSSVKVVEVF